MEGLQAQVASPFRIARPCFDSSLNAPSLYSLSSKPMDIVAESTYEPALDDSEPFELPYDDSSVGVGSLPPDQPLASRIGKARVYLYSENDAASRLGKVRLQLRRNFR